MTLIVFGSAGARMVPEGFSLTKGFEQYVDILRQFGPIAEENGVTIADIAANEPLNEAAAKKIAAAEHGVTYGTFHDVYRDIERAMRAE